MKFKHINKINLKNDVYRCNFCLELTNMRIVTANGTNRIACIICLNSVRFSKYKPLQEHLIIRTTPLTNWEVIKRQFRRIFIGNHVYGPFGIKRK